MPLATLQQIQGEALHPHAMGDTALACFGPIPWIDSLGVLMMKKRTVRCQLVSLLEGGVWLT